MASRSFTRGYAFFWRFIVNAAMGIGALVLLAVALDALLSQQWMERNLSGPLFEAISKGLFLAILGAAWTLALRGWPWRSR